MEVSEASKVPEALKAVGSFKAFKTVGTAGMFEIFEAARSVFTSVSNTIRDSRLGVEWSLNADFGLFAVAVSGWVCRAVFTPVAWVPNRIAVPASGFIRSAEEPKARFYKKQP